MATKKQAATAKKKVATKKVAATKKAQAKRRAAALVAEPIDEEVEAGVPSGKALVIVESPAKAKTIGRSEEHTSELQSH